MPKPKVRPWTADDDKQLRELCKRKCKSSAIALHLQRSEGAVRNRAQKVGLKLFEDHPNQSLNGTAEIGRWKLFFQKLGYARALIGLVMAILGAIVFFHTWKPTVKVTAVVGQVTFGPGNYRFKFANEGIVDVRDVRFNCVLRAINGTVITSDMEESVNRTDSGAISQEIGTLVSGKSVERGCVGGGWLRHPSTIVVTVHGRWSPFNLTTIESHLFMSRTDAAGNTDMVPEN